MLLSFLINPSHPSLSYNFNTTREKSGTNIGGCELCLEAIFFYILLGKTTKISCSGQDLHH